MSKKNLLNESQVRQFMKLASLEPLSPGFVHGLTEKQGADDREDEHLGAEDGKEADKKQSEKDRRKEMRGERRKKGEAGDPVPTQESQEIEEVRTGNSPTPNLQSSRRGHGRGTDGADRLEEESEEESELHATEDELGAEDELADEEGDELEAEAPEAPEGRMVSVDDFLSALESTLEGFLDDEVEVDSGDMAGDEMEVSAEVDIDGDDDLDMEDDIELEEGMFGGKDYEKMAKGKKNSYKPDPDAGEKDHTPTPEEIAKARAAGTTRTRSPRRSSGGGGGMTIGGLQATEGQEPSAELVEAITKRVAARILKSALAKK